MPVRWTPQERTEARALADGLRDFSPEGKRALLNEAIAVLGKCVPPSDACGDDTGLVIGYVQSGKTLNFTMVNALARDNGYPLVIVITGTSLNLFRQSNRRVLRDLGIESRRGGRKWRHFANPRLVDFDSVRGALENWRSGNVPDARRQAVLVTVMKHHVHLGHLNDLLEQLDMNGIPALIVDDEADQASMNNEVLQGEQSSTYARLLTLKSRLPHHTFIQYTATPQAPLLINIIDALSPGWVEVLTPGNDYVGGRDFFTDNSRYVHTIPANEIPTKRRPLANAPRTLLDAMQLYFIGVAHAIYRDDINGNRSMLVHPSRPTAPHGNYMEWITRAKRRWENTLAPSGDATAKQRLLEQFLQAYQDLAATVLNLTQDAPFEELAEFLPEAIRTTEVLEVNARQGSTPNIVWENAYSHILVGGQSMDRGFTVEGLTVTYMPRNIGVGNADSIQQRARFFGYKRAYFGFCRVFLEGSTRRAYEEYVRHEEDIRDRLIVHRDEGRPLEEWKRAFFLSPNLNPTRQNLLDVDYIHGVVRDDWFFPRGPHASPGAVRENQGIVRNFLSQLTLIPDAGHPDRTLSQQHFVAENVSLRVAFDQLLTRIRTVRLNDSLRYYLVLMEVRAWLDNNPSATCNVYRMSPNDHRERGLNSEGIMRTLHQGPLKRGALEIYPGDFKIKAATGLSIQIFSLTIKNDSGDIVGTDVPVIAVWVPDEFARPFFVQDQG